MPIKNIGLTVSSFYGNFNMRNATDIEFPRIDHDSSFVITLRYEDKLRENEKIYIQIATLYTNRSGIRRIRLINYGLTTTSKLPQIFKNADLDAYVALMMRTGMAVHLMMPF